MDCCNYVQYGHHQRPYFGSQYYQEPLPYHRDFYPRQMYQDYYGNIPYYPPQHWHGPFAGGGRFPPADYVYNPKEARIRKALREASRDRSIGASPMLPRPSARRANHTWISPQDDQLMMSPLAGGMRCLDPPPVYFPISGGTGSDQFMPPMNSAGYGIGKLERHLVRPPPPPPSTPRGGVHTRYMQPNPLAQLQQQTEMWHNFQDDIRPTSSGCHPHIMYDASPSYQHQPSPPLSIPSPMMMDNHRHTPQPFHHQVNHPSLPMTPPLSNIPMTPPHSNENVPPDEGFHSIQHSIQGFSANKVMETAPYQHNQNQKRCTIQDSVQPLMENNSGGVQDQTENFALDEYGHLSDEQHQKHIYTAEEDMIKKVRKHYHGRNGYGMAGKNPSPKPLPDFNEAFGSTERGRFQSPPDPRLAPNTKNINLDYIESFYEDSFASSSQHH